MITGVGAFRLALRCDRGGRVAEIVEDAGGLGARLACGESIEALAPPEGLERMRAFLEALAVPPASGCWRIDVARPGDPAATMPLYFTGGAHRDGLLVVAAESEAHAAEALDALTPIAAPPRDGGVYEKLSAMNNELATAQRALAKSHAELRRLDEQKNTFLGFAAHDLRNPLDVILTYSQYMLDFAPEPPSPKNRELLEVIRGSSLFMVELIDDLLDLAKIEAGRLALDLVSTDLGAVARKNGALNGRLAERKETRVVVETPAEPIVARIDPARVEQVLNNLVGNAVKFSPPGSEITVRVTRGDGAAIVSVTDQGPGVSPAELDAMVEPFATRGRRGTGGEKSTGLGLAITRKVAAAHGGRLWVEPAPGGGSTFHVAFPLQGPEDPA